MKYFHEYFHELKIEIFSISETSKMPTRGEKKFGVTDNRVNSKK